MKRFYTLLLLVLGSLAVVSAENLFNASTTTMGCWTMPGWQGTANTSFATWQDGVLRFTVTGNCTERWQCQIKLHTQGIVLDQTKRYALSCQVNSSKVVNNVTIKLFDDEVRSERADYYLNSGDNALATGPFYGGSVGNGIIVFDFGFALKGTEITLSDIVLEETVGNDNGGNEPSIDDEGYSLVWNEEFTDGQFDRSAWNIEVNGDGGGNSELQYYCEKAVTIEQDPVEHKHCLVLTATKEDYKGKKCTSGRVTTQNKVTFLYGKVEARIWFPETANGLWPAFWMMGNDIGSVGWPACGETDIVELGHSNGYKNGNGDRYFNGASHWGPKWDQHYQNANSIVNPYSVEDGFHIWTCIWTEDRVEMYVDRDAHPGVQPYYAMSIHQSENMENNNPAKYFHKPNFILLNLAIGGNFPGIWDINQITALQNGPRKMYIDWVRVYQKQPNIAAGSVSDQEEGEQTALPQTTSQPVDKVLRDGQILILRDGKQYNALGIRLF